MNAIDKAIDKKAYELSFLTSMQLLYTYKTLVCNKDSLTEDQEATLKATERLIYDRMKGEYEDDYDTLAKHYDMEG